MALHEELEFEGPLFIIGLPRSGTKLLRELLNNNDFIAIPTVETHFIPLMISKFNHPGEILTRQREFFKFFQRTSFYQNMVKDGMKMKFQDLESLDYQCWSSFCKSLLSLFIKKGDFIIWGDKSPSYLKKVSFLKRHFPDSKFLHIIRDPRDVAVSVKKMWNKSEIRAAYEWKKSIGLIRNQVHKFNSDYLEVRYEDILSKPQLNLIAICNFLSVQYSTGMLSLKKSYEVSTSTKGAKNIVKNNFNKYSSLDKEKLYLIERITHPLLSDLGYKNNFVITQTYEVKMIYGLFMKLYDLIQMIKYFIKTKGIRGIIYYYRIRLEHQFNEA
ncbi:MAG: sulfotransferase [Cyclobacteriaceae bacterium]